MRFNKPPLSIQDQVGLLKSRGLLIPDEKKALHYLTNISYYRLSAYMIPSQIADGSHRFTAGTTFDQVLGLYVFDRALRIHVFDAIERIEVALRAQIIQQMAMKHGPHWHEDPIHFRHSTTYQYLEDEIVNVCTRGKKEVFIEHYLTRYTDPLYPACWMCFETITMGGLSRIYNAIRDNSDRQAIANHFKLPHQVLTSWLHAISYIRNICAHHSRLWNRMLGVAPSHLTARNRGPWLNDPMPPNDRVYYSLCCMRYLLNAINPKGSFTERTKALLKKHNGVPLTNMGFVAGWENEPLWAT